MVSIKGTRQGLVIIFDPSQEFEEIKKNLRLKMESARGFFKGAQFTFYQDHQLVPQQRMELEAICRQYGLIPNLNIHWPVGQKKQPSPPVQLTYGEPTVLVYGTLRSGQEISHPGHVTILGDVHPGAEVTAGGHILIMGNCRGKVWAGAESNRRAVVVAMNISPVQLQIADSDIFNLTVRNPAGKPQVARLKNKEVIIEDLDDWKANALLQESQ